MAEKAKSLLGRVCGMVAKRVDAGRIADAKRRQADMFARRESDSIPILLGKPVPAAAKLPSFDLRERFHDPAKSLYMQLKDDVLPRAEGETVADYFRRVLSPYPTRTGLIFEGPYLQPAEVDGAVDLWRKVQDEKYR